MNQNEIQEKDSMERTPSKMKIWFQLLPLLFVIAIIPLICRVTAYSSKLTDYGWFSTEDLIADVFLCYKTQFFVGAVIVMFLFVVYKWIRLKKQIVASKLFLPLAVYMILVILSAVCSEYPEFVWSHSYEQFESAIVLVGYVVLAYYVYLFIETDYALKLTYGAFAFSALIISLIAFTQLIGHDLFETELGRHLILTKEYIENGAEIEFNFKMAGMAYGTLYNPNYLGVFSAMVIPVFVSLCFAQVKRYKTNASTVDLTGVAHKEKSRAIVSFIFYSILVVLLCLALVASQSKAGLLVLIGIAGIAVLFQLRNLLKRWYIFVPVVVVVVGAFLVINALKDNLYLGRLISALQMQKNEKTLEAFITTEDYVEMKYKGHMVYLTIEETEFGTSVTAKEGEQELVLNEIDASTYAFEAKEFEGITIKTDKYAGIPSFSVYAIGIEWNFVKDFGELDGYFYVNEFGRAVNCVEADAMLFEGYEHIASSRGYIWSRTLPLLKDNWLLGDGPNTFAVELPQNEYVAKRIFGFYSQVITKPHNAYLQTAQQSGTLSLVCVLVFFVLYLFQCLKLYIKSRFATETEIVGFGVFMAVLAYLVLALTNDSMIVVAPTFWALLGLGMALNRINKKR